MAKGLTAMDINNTGLSSAATRLDPSAPHERQRWTMAHSPFLRTHTLIGSMIPRQGDFRSPGVLSKWTLERHLGQWFRCCVPAFSGVTEAPHTAQIKLTGSGAGFWGMGVVEESVLFLHIRVILDGCMDTGDE